MNDALAQVKADPYQTELFKEAAKGDKVSLFKVGDFATIAGEDVLCYVDAVKNFKVLSVAGAYWQGKSSNPMLQRIYGTVFYKKKMRWKQIYKHGKKHVNVTTG